MNSRPPPQRIAYIDNARFLLICLVVVGHAVEPAVGQVDFLRHLHIAIYSFHIPLFAFLSGYFADRARRGLLRDVTGLLVPYLVFQVLYSVADFYAGGRETFFVSLITPTYLTWYLVSLLCWRWMARVFERIPLAIPVAFALGVGVGYLEFVDYRLSLSRTVVFFPFFLIGARVPRAFFQRLGGMKLRIAAGLLLAALLVEVVWWDPRLELDWFYGGQPYAAMMTGGVGIGGVVRLAIYGTAVVAGGAFLCLVPASGTFFSVWGTRSLGAYLVHGLLVKASVAGGLFELDLSPPWAQAALVAAAVAVAMLLSTRPAALATRAVVGQPWLDRAFGGRWRGRS